MVFNGEGCNNGFIIHFKKGRRDGKGKKCSPDLVGLNWRHWVVKSGV